MHVNQSTKNYKKTELKDHKQDKEKGLLVLMKEKVFSLDLILFEIKRENLLNKIFHYQIRVLKMPKRYLHKFCKLLAQRR